MVYSVDGTPLQGMHAFFWPPTLADLYTGLTGGAGGDRRVEHIIPMDARKKGIYEIVIESTCNGMFGVPWNGDTIEPPDVCVHLAAASPPRLTRTYLR